jgi:hypothetical protein
VSEAKEAEAPRRAASCTLPATEARAPDGKLSVSYAPGPISS